MKVIVYTQVGGSLAVIHPAPSAKLAEENEDQFLARIAAKDVPAGLSFEVIDQALLPSRGYRNAWKQKPGGIDHDMPKAREIHRNKMREVRKPKLESLDIEYQRADEDGNALKKKEIADKKKALRDVTVDPRIDAAQSIEALKAVWPDLLK